MIRKIKSTTEQYIEDIYVDILETQFIRRNAENPANFVVKEKIGETEICEKS